MFCLVAESRSLDRVRDAARLREIFSQAELLVDRKAQPKKWAAFRSMDAQLSENIDPAAALPLTARRGDRITEDLHDSRASPRTESLIGSAVQPWADRNMRRIYGAFGDSSRDKHQS